MGGESVRCSGCGGAEVLHVVTAGFIPGERQPGRLLVYCGDCRRRQWERPPTPGPGYAYDVSIPIELVTPQLFLRLYETGWTASSMETASRLVFGRVPASVRRKMAERRASEDG
jgi:hypothetical protein